MKRAYNIFKYVVISMLTLIVAVPMFVYVLISLPPIQKAMCGKAEKELTALLGTPVTIDNLAIAPFNRITLRGVAVVDEQGDTILKVRRLGAGVNPFAATVSDVISVDYIEAVELDLRLWKDNKTAPLNIAPIITRLKGDDNKSESSISLDIKTIVIRSSSITFDIMDEPEKIVGFDANHIGINDFRADISMPMIADKTYDITVKRISFLEKKGLNIVDLHADARIHGDTIALANPGIKLPASALEFKDVAIIPGKPVTLTTEKNSSLTPSDFATFEQNLSRIDYPLDLNIDVTSSPRRVEIRRLSVTSEKNDFIFNVNGKIDNPTSIDSVTVDIPRFALSANGELVADIASKFTTPHPRVSTILRNSQTVKVDIAAKGNPDNSSVKGDITTLPGKITFDVSPVVARDKNGKASLREITADIRTVDFEIGTLLDSNKFGVITLSATGEYAQHHGGKSGNANLDISEFHYNGYEYQNITANATLKDDYAKLLLDIFDDNADISAELLAVLNEEDPKGFLHTEIKNFNPNACRLISQYEGYSLSSDIEASFYGKDINRAMANITINDLQFIAEGKNPLVLENLTFTSDGLSEPAEMHLTSDFADADLTGRYDLRRIPMVTSDILAESFPELFADGSHVHHQEDTIAFKFNSTIKYNEGLNRFLNLPVNVIYPITIAGGIDSSTGEMNLDVTAPYLQQKDKLIEGSSLHFATTEGGLVSKLFVTTNIPTKEGAMNLNLDCNGAMNRLDTDLSWKIDRKRLYEGRIDLSTLFSTENDSLTAIIDINKSLMTFNDTTWTVNPATITLKKNRVEVEDFDVRRENQFVTMHGTASSDSTDILVLDLRNVNLDYIFESLGIDKAMLGGDATGTFYARNIFTPEPTVTTPGLDVKNISYNKTVFGDAIVKSHWDNMKREITLDADISQPNGLHSLITGGIFPLNDSLDITFDAQKIDVRFLKPYMEAFTQEISGIASGKARLFGTFKYIDLEGDIFAEDLKLKIDFTNTTYSATDSVHITPGLIKIDNIEIKDMFGNSATLNGEVRHKFFKEPEFDFFITDARNFLSYDVNSTINPDWYGRIFGNGGATIHGVPGLIDIYVDMSTAPRSTFTFVLSDLEVANEYSFITFRDREKSADSDTTNVEGDISQLVKQLKERMTTANPDVPSVYNMTLQIDVNSTAQLILVMDPVGGDRIRANGKGNLRMEYGSANEDLRMYGKYTLEKGNYNFTLQDIIIKDFTIKEGSTISFNGDPYAAQLDIDAFYSLNANLSDLDESFLQDKDLNRTNVPVHALMNVTGDVRSPDIAFDLEFPTLQSDTYRKVKSIISTEDMMNRQIIYLLALNRFYAPDYMGATTKGNELVSVASSTISSQLSSMLGELSDNWTIAPNFRSDKGDFSDVEVDLALSSSLLNNRLLFNGNFGYRDNSLNSNQFIGDFDLEYLLNKSGSLRLKAYNRYNDQNFYVKTATTTQGIGIVYRRDFDHILSFLYRLKEKRRAAKEAKEAAEAEQLEMREEVTDTIQTDQNNN